MKVIGEKKKEICLRLREDGSLREVVGMSPALFPIDSTLINIIEQMVRNIYHRTHYIHKSSNNESIINDKWIFIRTFDGEGAAATKFEPPEENNGGHYHEDSCSITTSKIKIGCDLFN